MATCSVLRCAQPASHLLPVNTAGAPPLEAAICNDHQHQVEVGAAWNWNHEQGEVLMGVDTYPRVSNWGTESGAGGSEVGEGLTLRLDLVQDGEATDILRLWVTKAQAADLAGWLSQAPI